MLLKIFERSVAVSMTGRTVAEPSVACVGYQTLELGGIPVHTEYRCLFFLRYEFLKYRNTGVI